MSETVGTIPSVKKQQEYSSSSCIDLTSLQHHHQPINKSPSKQAFNTIKNFLKSKSSLTDLRGLKERERDKVKDKDLYSINNESNKKLTDFKNKVPKKKRSLGSLLPSAALSSKNDSIKINEYLEEIKSMTAPTQLADNFGGSSSSSNKTSPATPTRSSTKNYTSSSPQLHMRSSISSSNKSASKVRFSFEDKVSNTINNYTTPIFMKNTSTPTLVSSNYTSDLNSQEWITPTTIRGTHVHDWSANMSPQSLTESIKVGKVTVGQPYDAVNVDDLPKYNKNIKSNNKGFIIGSLANDSKISGSEIKHYTKTDMEITASAESVDSSFESSMSSHNSQESQFSFTRNRTSSIRFYKSDEQVELEGAIYKDKMNRDKFNEFLGNGGINEIENELLDFGSIKSKKINNGLDDDMNFNDFEEDDETDALFNRDLFGLEDSSIKKPDNNLSLEIDNVEESSQKSLADTNNDVEKDDIGSNGDDKNSKHSIINENHGNDHDLSHKESSLAILQMLNNNDSGYSFKGKTQQLEIKHTPSAKLKRHTSLKFHHLSSGIESPTESDLSNNFDQNDIIFIKESPKEDQQINDFEDESYGYDEALDEINQVPEDYDDYYDEYSYQDQEIINNSNNNDNNMQMYNNNKGRFSTMLVSRDSENEDFDDCSNTNNNDGINSKHHLWKNLINGNTSNNAIVEKIKLENCTITLFNHPDLQDERTEEVEKNDDNIESFQGTEEKHDLSTIFE